LIPARRYDHYPLHARLSVTGARCHASFGEQDGLTLLRVHSRPKLVSQAAHVLPGGARVVVPARCHGQPDSEDHLGRARRRPCGTERGVRDRHNGDDQVLVRSTTLGPASSRSRRGARRAADGIGALSERLYEAVCRTPNEAMTVIAPVVGATARELNRPMLRLKQPGRIRSVGMRHATRYFPMARDAQRAST